MSVNIIAIKGYPPKYSFITSSILCTFFIQYFLLVKNHKIHENFFLKLMRICFPAITYFLLSTS